MAQASKSAGWLYRSIEDGRRYVRENEVWVAEVRKSLSAPSSNQDLPKIKTSEKK